MDDVVEVTVETTLGAKYIFPDMPRSTLENVIKQSGWSQSGRVILVNISGALLTMDARIVKCLSFDGAVKWPDAAVSELQGDGRTG